MAEVVDFETREKYKIITFYVVEVDLGKKLFYFEEEQLEEAKQCCLYWAREKADSIGISKEIEIILTKGTDFMWWEMWAAYPFGVRYTYFWPRVVKKKTVRKV